VERFGRGNGGGYREAEVSFGKVSFEENTFVCDIFDEIDTDWAVQTETYQFLKDRFGSSLQR
jgi:hypothetical protein